MSLRARSFAAVASLALTVFAAPALGRAAETEANPAPAAVTASSTTGDTAASPATDSADSDELAQREAASKGLEDFRGGDEGIYIGSGVLVAILVIVLIVLLIR